MLNSCPKFRSCGTRDSLYTDEDMPEEVGKATLIYAYRAFDDVCGTKPKPIQALRCSLTTDHDYIYRYVGEYINGTCYSAFCGMF